MDVYIKSPCYIEILYDNQNLKKYIVITENVQLIVVIGDPG